jgi:predicted metal-binding protein
VSSWEGLRKFRFSPSILQFDEKVREACRSCKRFGKVALCPPFVPSVDYYRSLLPTYRSGELVVALYGVPRKKDDHDFVGRQSSLDVHRQLLALRRDRFAEGHHFATAFGAGSCKFCVLGCVTPCRNPESGLVSIEGAGVDVGKLVLEGVGERLVFPIEEKFVRVGVVLYD